MKYVAVVNGREHEVELVERLGELHVMVDGKPLDIRYEAADTYGQVVLQCGERSFAASMEGDENEVAVTIAGRFYAVSLEDERERAAHAAAREAGRGGGDVKAIMPGVVVEVLVSAGEEVEKDQPLCILEAMKMQNEITAPGPGRVAVVHVEKGAAVSAGTKLVSIAAVE